MSNQSENTVTIPKLRNQSLRYLGAKLYRSSRDWGLRASNSVGTPYSEVYYVVEGKD